MSARHAAVAVTLLAAAALLSPRGAAAEPRAGTLLNDGWSFVLDDSRRPEPVELPHTWNAGDGRDKDRPYRRGIGVYRRPLEIPAALAEKRLWLYFEGANQVTEVSVNGRPAGRHVGGYSAFAFDVTDLVRTGESNALEVRVDNRHDDDVPPLNADFTFYGGLYRDVRLLALDPVHFRLDEYAATDVRIVATPVSAEQASVRIDAGIANTSGAAREVVVEATIMAADGTVVARNASPAALDAGVTQLTLGRFEIEDPELWSPETPRLYRVTCTIEDRSGPASPVTLDRVTYPLGLRWFGVDADGGFRLNGSKYRLFGTNRHQDHAGLGNALPNAVHRRDLEIIRDQGFNFVRLAHYPQDPAVLEAADELGLLVWEETPVVNLVTLSGAFRENATRMVREMIRQHRHHPSIVFWGYMNEVTLRDPEPMPAGYHEQVVALARHLDGVAHEEDPTRATVMALSRDEVLEGVPLHAVPDVLGLNLYFGWYYEELDSLGPFLDRYREAHPGLPLFISEYGAGSDERVHALQPDAFDFSTEYQQRFHEAAFRQILERPWLVGSAVWAQFDFGSNHRQDTKFGLNQKGLAFHDRTPKDIAYFYAARLDDEPVLHIAARDWPRRAGSGPGDETMPVRVYSNEASVDLSVNGVSLGSQSVRDAAATWDVSFAPGQNRLVARSANREDQVIVHYEDRSGLFRDGSTAGANALLVNAGGAEQIIDRDGRAWEADREYSEGSWGHVGGEPERSHHRIFGTDDDPLYQTRRLGAHSYRFDVADGRWRVALRLAALGETSGQERAFVVAVNGRSRELPVPAPFTRSDVELEAAATGGNGIEVRFSAGSAAPFVNGIAVERMP